MSDVHYKKHRVFRETEDVIFYDISVEEDAGYDLKTLLPNRMRITLNTSELRTGDFSSFRPGSPVKRDTVAGWEALGEFGTTDPGYLQ